MEKETEVLCPYCKSELFEMRTFNTHFFNARKEDKQIIAEDDGNNDTEADFICGNCNRDCNDIFNENEISWE